MKKPKRILFLCVANSARSQLAEGLAKSIFEDEAIIQSAGSEPSGLVQPWAVEVLKEIGIDISKYWSKSIDQLPLEFIANLDFVITLCAEEICPILSLNSQRIHWPILDPAKASEETKAEAFRSARNQIRDLLIQFKSEINQSTNSSL